MSAPLSVAGDIGVAIAAFASTNIDDVFLLLAFFADEAYSKRRVVLGQYLGIGALVAVSFAASIFASQLPVGLLRWLGAVPLAIGLYRAWQLRREAKVGEDPHPAGGGALGVALVTVASGGDNVAVYVPVFATHMRGMLVFVLVFAVMTAAWCWLAHAVVSHPVVGRHLRRGGRIAVPVVLVLLGISILLGA